ncbi:hypothetical protein A2U01_0090103, partial [Trifolium medium]|nr:hypothetical protein [Trifolium medium]
VRGSVPILVVALMQLSHGFILQDRTGICRVLMGGANATQSSCCLGLS